MTEYLPSWAVQVAIFYTGASLVASLLVSFIPTPAEIARKWYTVLFNCLQRLSVVRRAWNTNGDGRKSV